ncbi:DUF6479 family protein [Streptomyces sp. NPDC051041]|uniref:DUF6479 family protein n=1 Tax=Streptomyces sp. NPDC051041 TaxID=3365640 RepID=UPI00379DF1ED
MTTATHELLTASSEHALNMTAAFIGGMVVAGLLIWAVPVGMRLMDKDTGHPRPEEQPKLPDSGPVREIREQREPDEVPIVNGGPRLMPYELHHANTRTCKDQSRRRWQPGSSGSFGSGGLGHV